MRAWVVLDGEVTHERATRAGPDRAESQAGAHLLRWCPGGRHPRRPLRVGGAVLPAVLRAARRRGRRRPPAVAHRLPLPGAGEPPPTSTSWRAGGRRPMCGLDLRRQPGVRSSGAVGPGSGLDAMDAWFEEDEEIFVHPRSPSTRVQILPSSRHVVVRVDGVVVAESSRPTFLYETGLPRRTYFSKLDVRMDLLTPTATTTRCPWRGARPSVDDRLRLPDDAASGLGVVLPGSVPGVDAGRRAGGLLRRAGRRHRRRGPAGPAGDALLLNARRAGHLRPPRRAHICSPPATDACEATVGEAWPLVRDGARSLNGG